MPLRDKVDCLSRWKFYPILNIDQCYESKNSNERRKKIFYKHYVKNNRTITILWLEAKCVIPQRYSSNKSIYCPSFDLDRISSIT
jgi:hypothetical protein